MNWFVNLNVDGIEWHTAYLILSVQTQDSNVGGSNLFSGSILGQNKICLIVFWWLIIKNICSGRFSFGDLVSVPKKSIQIKNRTKRVLPNEDSMVNWLVRLVGWLVGWLLFGRFRRLVLIKFGCLAVWLLSFFAHNASQVKIEH